MVFSMEINVKYNYSEEESKLMEPANVAQFQKAVNNAAEELADSLGATAGEYENFDVSILKDGQLIAKN